MATNLTKNEQLVLYGLTKYPHKNDSTIANLLNLKLSTYTSIKRRLKDQELYRTIALPLLNKLGCELFTITHTTFNPVIPLEERIHTTTKTIEVFPEIFFSIGEQEQGFSLSLSENYTELGRINDIRTQTFGSVGLLEDEYPEETIYPFKTSKITRFFDFTRPLNHLYNLNQPDSETPPHHHWFAAQNVPLSAKEKHILATLVQNPTQTTQQIGEKINLSRHTISRMKHFFQAQGLLKYITIPNFTKLGYSILTVYHIKLNPQNSSPETDLTALDTHSTILFSQRHFEFSIISIYSSYQEFKEDMMIKIRYLKEHNLIRTAPKIFEYPLERSIIIKPVDLAPITKHLLSPS